MGLGGGARGRSRDGTSSRSEKEKGHACNIVSVLVHQIQDMLIKLRGLSTDSEQGMMHQPCLRRWRTSF